MTAPEPTPYTPTDEEQTPLNMSDVRLVYASIHNLNGVAAFRAAEARFDAALAAHDARVRAEAVLDYMRTKEIPRVEITPLAGPARPGPMSTLHDRDADYFRAILDDAASHRELTVVEREIRAVLAETTTTQPYPDHGWRPDDLDASYRRAAVDHNEPEPVEREALGRLLWLGRGGSLPGAVPWETFPESVKEDWRRCADPILAAGFRRSRPEAS